MDVRLFISCLQGEKLQQQQKPESILGLRAPSKLFVLVIYSGGQNIILLLF